MLTRRWLSCAILCAASASAGCTIEEGDQGLPGAPGAPGSPAATPDSGDRYFTSPGVNLVITGVSGGGSAGSALTVTFTLKKDDGTAWDLAEMDTGLALVSGPTFNYQRVIPRVDDVRSRAAALGGGAYSYTFASAMPSSYAAPYNDTTSFGSGDGELAGQSLLAGTYTVYLNVGWDYTADGESFRSVGEGFADFLFGGATTLQSREVLTQANCNACHQDLRAHGDNRRDVRSCVLCHTSGAEDKNVSTVAGGTPGVAIDFRVMVHALHNGGHLPSVLGVSTNTDGSRNYGATPVPLEYVGFGNSIHDMSAVKFPVMPSAYVAHLYDTAGTTYSGAAGNGPMPRDAGFGSLSAANRLLEDRMRTGVVSCDTCHGDPDGGGPASAPAQGALHDSQPTRRSCGACHDDVVWSRPYTANGQTMPAQSSDANCTSCHAASGNGLAVHEAHDHPWTNPALNTGVNASVSAVGGGTGSGGRHQAGDPVTITLAVTDDAGTDVAPVSLARFQVIVGGPSTNPQIAIAAVSPWDNAFRKSTPFTGSGSITKPAVGGTATRQTIAVVFTSATSFDLLGTVSSSATGNSIGGSSGSTASFTYAGVSATITQGATAFAAGDRWYFEVVPTASSHTFSIPMDVTLERVGVATGGADAFTVGNAPLRWGRQVVREQTAVGTSVTVAGGSAALGRTVTADKAALDSAGVAVGDTVVLDAGTSAEEFAVIGRIQTTDDRTGADLGTADVVWFTSALRFAHGASGTLREATLTARREGVDYTVSNPGSGQITLVSGQFGNGNPVVVSYRTDGRFGWRRGPGDSLQAVYLPASQDSDEIGLSWGDWKGLALVDGTYTVGLWANIDFTVSPAGAAVTTEAWNNWTSNNTTYRMISPPVSRSFLYGAATALVPRVALASAAACNACHGDLQFHGNGRRGLDTCLHCHSMSGMEDAPKYSFSTWYVGPTPDVTMDFRTMIHKVHMGTALPGAAYVHNGIFLGVPYAAGAGTGLFPAMPGEARNCTACHSGSSTNWQEPATRGHPSQQTVPVREWRAACLACHATSATAAHADLNTSSSGYESCATCHGVGRSQDVATAHRSR